MARLQLGLIGCGEFGGVHADCISRIAEAEFVAYADICEEAAIARLNKFGGRYATSDSAKIFADDSIDAVYICTRHDSHASLTIAAAKAGKHIMLEKPLALSIEECEAVAATVEREGVYLMPAFKMRYYPMVQRMHEFIPEPMLLVGQMMDDRWPDNSWIQDPEQGGANVLSQGCHTADILRYFAGSEPERIWAAGGTMTHPGHPCIDQMVATMQLANGSVASWVQGDAAMGQFTSKFFFQLFGDGKSVQMYDRCMKATFFDGDRTWTEERKEEEGFQLENQEFIQALLQDRQPEVTVYDGVQATRLVLAAEQAVRTGEIQVLQQPTGPIH